MRIYEIDRRSRKSVGILRRWRLATNGTDETVIDLFTKLIVHDCSDAVRTAAFDVSADLPKISNAIAAYIE